MGDSSASYIHMVHHLIEECIIFNMSKEECMEALSKHANINPIITSTVWKELKKENKEFFEGYEKRRDERASEMEAATHRIHNLLLESLSNSKSSTTTTSDDQDNNKKEE
ncbi:uncharacterized protein LOC132293492 [Cornus florida]|uniref:uncharacterized protein LOC132293492 n=1 Tax=Cornus florida TaxID=4283 RepID=UPI00289A33EF|nr:uncharacterized protein LOC132293492 [Cornus florida]